MMFYINDINEKKKINKKENWDILKRECNKAQYLMYNIGGCYQDTESATKI